MFPWGWISGFNAIFLVKCVAAAGDEDVAPGRGGVIDEKDAQDAQDALRKQAGAEQAGCACAEDNGVVEHL